MHNIKKSSLVIFVFFIAVSCKKTVIQEDPVPASKAFSTLNVSNNFNWSSTKAITVTVQGLATTNPTMGTLSLRTTDGRGVFYMGSHQLSQDLILRITVPASQDSLQIQFGSILKKYAITGTTLAVNYLPTIEPDAP